MKARCFPGSRSLFSSSSPWGLVSARSCHPRGGRRGSYALLLPLPGAQSIRVPARAWLPAAMCLAVCAGLGASRLTTSRWGKGALAALALGIVAEGWFFDGSMAAPVSMLKGVIPAGAVVLDLPIAEAAGHADPQYLAVLRSL